MAIKDYIPDKKYVIGAVLGAVLGASLVGIAVVNGAFEQEFVPSKETCDKYFESRNGRYICLIAGQRTEFQLELPVEEEAVTKEPTADSPHPLCVPGPYGPRCPIE